MIREAILLTALAVLGGLMQVAWAGLPEAEATTETSVAACEAPDMPSASASLPTWLSADAAREWLGEPSVFFLDARDESEFVRGHVAGALSVPPSQASPLPPKLKSLLSARGTRVVVYCDTVERCGKSTRLGHQVLADTTVADVRILEGGMPTWVEKGFPAESGACRECTWLGAAR